jgi:hypothetical protein
MYSEQISTEKMPSEQMNQIAAVVQKLFPALVADIKIQAFAHPKIEEKFGEINLTTIPLKNPDGMPLLVIPGYSFKSFKTMLGKMKEGIEFLENKYSVIHMINWGERVKRDTSAIDPTLTEEQQFAKNEEYRIELAKLMNKCISSPDLNLKNFAILGKSAGGGVSMHMTGANLEVKKLFVCCPGTNSNGSTLVGNPDLKIYISWNTNDEKLPCEFLERFKRQMSQQGSNFKWFLYDLGPPKPETEENPSGHELNVQFLKDIQDA